MNLAPVDQLLFEGFFSHLRGLGFEITIEQHLRVYELLGRHLDGDFEPAAIKTLLCPLIATNEVQQHQFYDAFDQYYPLWGSIAKVAAEEKKTILGSVDPGAPDPVPIPLVERHRAPWTLYAGATACLFALLVIGLWTWLRSGPSELKVPTPSPTPSVSAVPAPSDVIRVDTGPSISSPSSKRSDDTQVDTPKATPPVAIPSHPTESQPLPILNQTANWDTVRQILLIAFPLLTWIGVELYYWRRRRLILRRRSGLRPPHMYPLRLKDCEVPAYASPGFLAAVQRLRARRPSARSQLDIPSTIQNSLRALGYPVLRYRSQSETPEYLVLVDRNSPRDHQSLLFSQLVEVLRREGVFAQKYTFDSDLRTCWNETGQSASLSDLERQYGSSHRLLVLSDGDRLLDPVTGGLATWAECLKAWNDRVLLTPQPAENWSFRERQLAELLLVLPATTESLTTLVARFENIGYGHSAGWPQEFRKHDLPNASMPPRWDAPPHLLLEDLRRFLGQKCLTWLCACAVYPELHWPLTLLLATLDSMPTELLTEENLLRLVRLPWFRSGFLPDELRWLLVRELGSERERSIRECIVKHLEKVGAPPGSHAAEILPLQIATQRYLMDRSSRNWNSLRRLLDATASDEAFADYTLLKTIEAGRTSALDFLLPPPFRRLIIPDNRGSATAWKMALRFSATLAIVALGLSWQDRDSDPHQKHKAKEDLRKDGPLSSVEIRTIPSGAQIRVANQVIDKRCVTNCRIELPPGKYAIAALLEGFEPVAAGLVVDAEPTPPISLTLTPQALSLRIYSDLGGQVSIDGKTVGDIRESEFVVNGVPPGNHAVRVSGPGGEATFAFTSELGKPPRITAPPATRNLLAALVAGLGDHARLHTSVDSLALRHNGQIRSPVGPNGVDLDGLSEGEHEIILGEGPEARKIILSSLHVPTLTAYFKSDVNAGFLVVDTAKEDGVLVRIDGKQIPRKSLQGKLRVQLPPGTYKVSAHKDGFIDSEIHDVEIRKGQEISVGFRLQFDEVRHLARAIDANLREVAGATASRLAELHVTGARVGTLVSVNRKLIGKIGPGGSLATLIEPGQKTIDLSLEGHYSRQYQRLFRAGERTHLSDAELSPYQEYDLPTTIWNAVGGDSGTLVVVAGNEDHVVISIDGKVVPQSTVGGRLRIALRPGRYRIGAMKKGFTQMDEQYVDISQGRHSFIEFEMELSIKDGVLRVTGARLRGRVLVDGRQEGVVGPGIEMAAYVKPGDHIVDVLVDGQNPLQFRRTFSPGRDEIITLSDSTARSDESVVRAFEEAAKGVSSSSAPIAGSASTSGGYKLDPPKSISLGEVGNLAYWEGDGSANVLGPALLLASRTLRGLGAKDSIGKFEFQVYLPQTPFGSVNNTAVSWVVGYRSAADYLMIGIEPARILNTTVGVGSRFVWSSVTRGQKRIIGVSEPFKLPAYSSRIIVTVEVDRNAVTSTVSPVARQSRLGGTTVNLNGQDVRVKGEEVEKPVTQRWIDPKLDFAQGRFGVLIYDRTVIFESFSFKPKN